MKKHILRSVAIPFLAFIFILGNSACKRPIDGVQVSKINFEIEEDRQVNQADNLVFTFNEDLVPKEKLYKKDSLPYLTFQPPLRGYFKWTATNQLTFFPQKILPPSTDFTAKITPKVLTHSSDLKLSSETSFDFHTEYLRLKSASVFWKQSTLDNNKPILGGELNFNHKVTPEKLAKQLKVTLAGKSTKYTILNTSNTQKIQLDIEGDKVKKGATLRYEILEGMGVVGTDWTTKEALTYSMSVSSSAELRIENITANHDGTEGEIVVITSQQVEKTDLKSAISLKPSIPFTVNANSNGFVIVSEKFDVNIAYELRIAKKITGIFKGKLDEDYEEQIIFGKLEPKVEFVSTNSMYLGKAGKRNMGMSLVNIDKINVKVYKVFANNIMTMLQGGKQWGYHDHYNEEGDYYDYYNYRYYDTERYAKLVEETEYNVKDLERLGKLRLLNLGFRDRLERFDGIYLVEVQDATKDFLKDSKVVAFSDIGMIAKQEKDKIYVFTNSIHTAQPMAGVSVNFISKTNQEIYSATSNERGVAIFDAMEERAPNFELAMITAQRGDDFNFMELRTANVSTSRFEVGGKYQNPANYEAFIYGDRNLYRPGETMHISAIVRSNDWETPKDLLVKVKVLMPNGKEFKTLRKNLDEQGSLETSVTIPESFITGTYTVEVYTADDILLNSKPISVEEFMPDRIKVNIDVTNKEMKPGESVELNGTALNLFGPPAADRKYEVEMNLNRKAFQPKRFNNYTFHIDSKQDFGAVVEEGKTDEEGKFSQSIEIPEEYKNMGVLSGRLFATVFDETGRPVNRVENFEVFTQETFYGIGHIGSYHSTRQPLDIPLVAVNKSGEAVNATTNVEVIRYEWRTVLESRGNGRYRYKSQREAVKELSKDIRLSGADNNFTFIPPHSGSYEIRIAKAGTNDYVKQRFYAYGWGDTENTSFAVNQEGKIDIELDKESYKVGETAKVLFTTPFEGTILVTLEQNEVKSYLYTETRGKAAELSFELTNDYVPNVFVSATLIRPMKDLGIPLTVAHGYAPLVVENELNQMPIEIVAAEKSRSQTSQLIKIKTAPYAQVTVAVVDEGILQIKDYATPDPYAFFYQQRALGVESYDIYPYLFPEMVGGEMMVGGGEGLGKRVNPVSNKRVELVSHWSGRLEADNRGNVEYEAKIPQFSGDLRVMAVAYDEQRFGGADAHIKVADPIVISPGLPRFFSPGDQVSVPVTLSNTTSKTAKAKVSLLTEDLLKVAGGGTETISIPPNTEKKITYQINVAQNMGLDKVTVKVDALGETFTHETELSVRPPASLQKRSGSGVIKAGKNETVDLATKFIPATVDGKLLVSSSPLVEFAPQLQKLIGYPHGCLEQTISKAFPQIYVYELSKQLLGDQAQLSTGRNANNPNYNVQEAIKKLESMQKPVGAMPYWRGGSHINWWGNVFAAHFFLEAKKAGFEVNDDSLNRLLKYVRKSVRKKETFTYVYFDDGERERKEIAHKEIPYSLFVLALAGKPEKATMNYYKANLDLLSVDGKYLLSAAYALLGDRSKAKMVRPDSGSFDGEKSEQQLGGSFHSPIRDKAIALYSLLEADPDNQQIGTLAKHLADDFKKQRYLNTQEKVFTLLSFGKMAKTDRAGSTTATVTADGRKVGNFSGKDLVLSYDDISAESVEISTSGNGNLYYFWNLEGLTADGSYEEKDSYLEIRKTFYDRFGKKITKLDVEQNDLIAVKLALRSTGANSVENVVVSDMLPAGFEIENPRISKNPGMEWIKNASLPDHQDFRDDRVHLFTTATKKAKSYYYIVRAVSPGTFKMGPASADAMYNGEYHSYNGGGTVVVR